MGNLTTLFLNCSALDLSLNSNKVVDQLLPFVYMVGVILLVLPAFLQSNSKLKQFLTNLTIWIVIILIILTIIYFIKK